MTAALTTDLLIIGAGPFGLAMAAHAGHLGIDHIIVGEPMGFWRSQMPAGMYLRSACDWHLDPEDEATIEAFLRTQNLQVPDVEPLSRDRYLHYARWFQQHKRIDPWPVVVERLETVDGPHARFRATLTDGRILAARHVVLALGFAPFTHVPDDLARLLPAGAARHTCDFTDFSDVRGQRCLIVGGRQSAFEWSALMAESGAAAVHVAHRHDSPAFASSDWSWVNPLVDDLVSHPGWYRRLTDSERDALNRRFWTEGRLKLEPWLGPRVAQPAISVWANTRLTAVGDLTDGGFAVTLAGEHGARVVEIDRIVLATGYRVAIARVPLLARGNLLPQLQIQDGAPVLDRYLQSSVPGLFMTSMLAVRDFGPFFAFTVAVRASARLIGRAIRHS